MTPTRAAIFEAQLAAYRDMLEPHIAALCERLEADAAQDYGDFSRKTIEVYTSILHRGGKRIRGSLVLAGYEMCGGTDIQRVMPVAIAVEMLQAYLLILDDVYDYSDTRRGGPTAHIMMRDVHSRAGWRGDSLHFGEVSAGLSALIGSHWAMREIATSPLDDRTKNVIIQLINEAMVITGYGQLSDVYNEAVREVDEQRLQQMLTWKTAYYSFVNPLQVGAVAAGEPFENLACLKEYGVHIGLAFQIADDILGTFGDESKSGKSTKDDLREGKMTLLVSHALSHANSAQREALLSHLGNHNLNDAQYEECKDIIRQTGALDNSRNMANAYVEKAIAALDEASAHWGQNHLVFLRDLAQYVLSRKA